LYFVGALEIDDHVLEKIEAKHGIVFGEVESACYSQNVHVRRSRNGLYKLFAQTEAGRYLLVVLVHASGGLWRVATARDMTAAEKGLYLRATGRK